MAAVVGKVNGVGFGIRDAESGSDNGGGSDLEAQLSTNGPKYVIIIWGNFLCLIY